LLSAELIAEGSLSEVAVYPRVLMERALVHRAKTVVLLHNHPSEELRPSSYDLDLTRSIVNLMQGVAINVLDHLIVGSDRWFSFRESGLFWHTQSGLQKSSLQLAEGEEDPAAIFYIKEG
ncbi:MAG: JAB domain-containing protein, partial [Clostridia bacterium]|nr:JAB domain-containing protein [Clostridia bacterium]